MLVRMIAKAHLFLDQPRSTCFGKMIPIQKQRYNTKEKILLDKKQLYQTSGWCNCHVTIVIGNHHLQGGN